MIYVARKIQIIRNDSGRRGAQVSIVIYIIYFGTTLRAHLHHDINHKKELDSDTIDSNNINSAVKQSLNSK